MKSFHPFVILALLAWPVSAMAAKKPETLAECEQKAETVLQKALTQCLPKKGVTGAALETYRKTKQEPCEKKAKDAHAPAETKCLLEQGQIYLKCEKTAATEHQKAFHMCKTDLRADCRSNADRALSAAHKICRDADPRESCFETAETRYANARSAAERDAAHASSTAAALERKADDAVKADRRKVIDEIRAVHNAAQQPCVTKNMVIPPGNPSGAPVLRVDACVMEGIAKLKATLPSCGPQGITPAMYARARSATICRGLAQARHDHLVGACGSDPNVPQADCFAQLDQKMYDDFHTCGLPGVTPEEINAIRAASRCQADSDNAYVNSSNNCYSTYGRAVIDCVAEIDAQEAKKVNDPALKAATDAAIQALREESMAAAKKVQDAAAAAKVIALDQAKADFDKAEAACPIEVAPVPVKPAAKKK